MLPSTERIVGLVAEKVGRNFADLINVRIDPRLGEYLGTQIQGKRAHLGGY